MEYRPLGRTGLKVGALSFGSYGTFGDRVDLPPYHWGAVLRR